VIGSLAGLLYSTYLNNVYFQAYVDSISPVLVPVLSVAFGISSASLATYLYLGMKRIRTLQEPETFATTKKKAHPRKMPKHLSQVSGPSPKLSDPSESAPAKLKPIAPFQSHGRTQKPPVRQEENQKSDPNKTKHVGS
jgi:hypothetical protein